MASAKRRKKPKPILRVGPGESYDNFLESEKDFLCGVACGGLPREGSVKYAVMIRHPNDPERSTREERKAKREREGILSTAHLRKDRTPVEQYAEEIRRHMADCIARTANRLSIELWDKEASYTMHPGSLQFEALDGLVQDGEIGHTMVAPIKFAALELEGE